MSKPNNQEVWKPLPVEHFAAAYQVSNTGKVRSMNYKQKKEVVQEIVISKKKDGYYYVNLRYQGVRLTTRIHKMVAMAFLPNPEGKDQVNHKNGRKQDNWVENLEWMTQSENIQHSIKTGLRDSGKPVEEIDEAGKVLGWFVSIKEASRQTGVRSDYISRVCRGINKSAAGRLFRFGYPWTESTDAVQKQSLKQKRKHYKSQTPLPQLSAKNLQVAEQAII